MMVNMIEKDLSDIFSDASGADLVQGAAPGSMVSGSLLKAVRLIH